MLTISLDRVTDLLDKAADVEIDIDDPEAAEDDAAYLALLDAIGELSPVEVQQLLTLDRLGDEESSAETWQDADTAVQAIPEPERLYALIDALMVADGIEAALEELGFASEEEGQEEEEEEGEEEEGEEEEGEEEEGEEEGREATYE